LRGVRPRPIDRRTEKEKGSGRNARRHFADAIRNPGADGETETGEAETENEKEGDPDAYAKTEGEEDSRERRRGRRFPETEEISGEKIR
jgi:hypothetical protein